MRQEKYNGWTNRETWLVNLHFDKVIDVNIQEWMYHEETHENRQVTLHECADQIQSYFEAIMESEMDSLSSFITDYLDFSLIDWVDLAEQYVVEPVGDDEE